MLETGSYKFDLPHGAPRTHSIIKVIGVGGGGSNAVNHMFRQGIKDVEFVVCNTDVQALNASPVPTKLQIGADLTEGLGCGANPKIGKGAALESKELIREFLQGTKMLFVTAGMGGGTGTGAAPVIAKIAKSMGILTVGIVTMPFSFEGPKKRAQAELGIKALRQSCDTVLVIINDKLREMYGNLPIGKAFAEADNVLTTAAKGIAEIITLTGYVNVDFQDVRTVMLNAGPAVMGTAETRGENRAIKAASGALTSPLLDNCDIMGARKILLSIVSGEEAELQMDELTQITEYIQERAGQEAEVIFGHGVDPQLGDRLRVTIIATGFTQHIPEEDRKNEPEKKEEVKKHDLERSQIWNFEPEITVQQQREIELKVTPPPAEKKPSTGYGSLFDELVQPDSDLNKSHREVTDSAEDDLTGEDGLFAMDEELNELPEEKPMQKVPLKNTNAGLEATRERLRQQAEQRKQQLSSVRKQEMTREDFMEKWSLPAYVRRGVKMDNVPHSSEPFVSKYNLNEDNTLLGNNKFLHDNVD
ncbi:MAG: cell division protein FtsZ [Cyclobacteriaceae bacterium]|nr:cell division protein FtsZ [Cyclobacteriaceae bacterium]